MSSSEPAWALTDGALVLILHAESDMARAATASDLSSAPTGRERLIAARNDVQWSRESAILRLISTIEAYTDGASTRWLHLKGLQAPAKPPFSWRERKERYAVTHTTDLTNCAGWDKVDAGVNLRNCLAHGLGALTQYLLADPEVGRRMLSIHVDVHGGRMHPRATTVPLLAAASREYVRDLETHLIRTL